MTNSQPSKPLWCGSHCITHPLTLIWLLIKHLPDCSLPCFNGHSVLDLRTRKVIRSVIFSQAFAIFLLWKFRACVWNSKLCYPPPHPPSCLQNSSPWNSPLPWNSKILLVVWYGYFLESSWGYYINNTHVCLNSKYDLCSKHIQCFCIQTYITVLH